MVKSVETGQDFIFDIQLEAGYKPLTMIWVPPGDFVMGNNHKYIEPEVKREGQSGLPVSEMPARISKGFWLSKFPVTVAQWRALVKLFSQKVWDGHNSKADSDTSMELQWIEAMHFCRELNIGYKSFIPQAYHFSLPTELQWEYVAKAGQEDIDYTFYYKEICNSDRRFVKETELIRRDTILENKWGFQGLDMFSESVESCYDIPAGIAPDIQSPEEYRKLYTYENGKVIDWVGNMNPEHYHSCLFDLIEMHRINKGKYLPTYRNSVMPYIQLPFRLCLRPISNWKYCDLNDPWLKENGINILGE